jgi:hypothetical protein
MLRAGTPRADRLDHGHAPTQSRARPVRARVRRGALMLTLGKGVRLGVNDLAVTAVRRGHVVLEARSFYVVRPTSGLGSVKVRVIRGRSL